MIRVLTVGIDGPLEPHAAGFADALFALGFTRLSAANQLRVFAHVSRWLAKRRFRALDFTAVRAHAFLRARRRAGYTCWRTPRGLERILNYLRELRVVPMAPVVRPRSAIDRLVASYDAYLSDERGLAKVTIRRLTDCAHRFVAEFGATRSALRSVSPADVRGFLRTVSTDYSPASLAGFGSDLRSFFRFLLVTGIVRRSLAEAVPPALGWHDHEIPRGISASEVRRLLRSCDRRTAVGRRDFAVLMLLTRLGLRAGEVLSLTIDDIDWRLGEIVIHGKGSKRDRLPLPDDVGHALSAYIVHRPHTIERRVFLRDRAPHRALHAVGFVVFAASRRAALAPIWPHRLRRTAATEMLRRGASLQEIAEVLRHTVTQTTAIYAKVDRRTLRTLVQPWPGARV